MLFESGGSIDDEWVDRSIVRNDRAGAVCAGFAGGFE